MRSRGFGPGCLLWLVLVIGCAYQDATVRAPALATVTAGSIISGSPAVVLVTPFADARPDRSRCGVKKVFSKESARIECGAAPGQWLADLLAQELRAAGFRVYDKQPPPGQPAVRIEGVLTQLFVEPDVAGEYYVFYARSHYLPEADIAVSLVARGEHFEAERRFYFKGAGDYLAGGLESNYQRALDNSVKEGLRLMSTAIGELVNLAPGFEAYACTAAPPAVTVQR